MAKVRDAVPSGKGAIQAGTKVCLGVKEAINVNIGSGTITQLSDYELSGEGAYDFDVLGYSGKGTWAISLVSSNGGKTYDVKVRFTGTYDQDVEFDAAAIEFGKPTDCNASITYVGGGHTISQSCQCDTWLQKAKIWFGTQINGRGVDLYMYSSDEYGSC